MVRGLRALDCVNPSVPRIRSLLAETRRLAARTVQEWIDDEAQQWGAAIAFYTVVSLGPLVVLGLTVLGRLFGSGAAERRILEQVDVLLGPRAVEVTHTLLESAEAVDPTSLGAILTLLLLLLAATAVFTNLQRALNRIWEVEPASGALKAMVRSRLVAFGMVLALGGLVAASTVLGTLIGWLGPALAALPGVTGVLPSVPTMWLLDALVSLTLLWLFVGATFWILPDVEISWRDVRIGALVTAALRVLGKSGLAAFLARNDFASMYGAAGSIFLLLLWVYYSAHAFFLGAEFTQVWAAERGRTLRPEPHAVEVREVVVDEAGTDPGRAGQGA